MDGRPWGPGDPVSGPRAAQGPCEVLRRAVRPLEPNRSMNAMDDAADAQELVPAESPRAAAPLCDLLYAEVGGPGRGAARPARLFDVGPAPPDASAGGGGDAVPRLRQLARPVCAKRPPKRGAAAVAKVAHSRQTAARLSSEQFDYTVVLVLLFRTRPGLSWKTPQWLCVTRGRLITGYSFPTVGAGIAAAQGRVDVHVAPPGRVVRRRGPPEATGTLWFQRRAPAPREDVSAPSSPPLPRGPLSRPGLAYGLTRRGLAR